MNLIRKRQLIQSILCISILLWVDPLRGEDIPKPHILQQDANCHQLLSLCQVNGEPLLMMLDTGATHTVLHKESAKRVPGIIRIDTRGLDIKGNSNQCPDLVQANLSAGGTSFDNHIILIFDLQPIRSMMAEKIDGILGMDVLSKLPFTIDQRNGSHWGEPSDPKGWVKLAGQHDPFGRFFTTIHSQEQPIQLLLDTGCTLTQLPANSGKAGTVGTCKVRLSDINTAQTSSRPLAAIGKIQLAPGVPAQQIRPNICTSKEPSLLGLDALRDISLCHKPSTEQPGGHFFIRPLPAETP